MGTKNRVNHRWHFQGEETLSLGIRSQFHNVFVKLKLVKIALTPSAILTEKTWARAMCSTLAQRGLPNFDGDQLLNCQPPLKHL